MAHLYKQTSLPDSNNKEISTSNTHNASITSTSATRSSTTITASTTAVVGAVRSNAMNNKGDIVNGEGAASIDNDNDSDKDSEVGENERDVREWAPLSRKNTVLQEFDMAAKVGRTKYTNKYLDGI